MSTDDWYREKRNEMFYSRECPECMERVNRKAKTCKECGFTFEDWEEQRKDIEHWEERGRKVKCYPWDKKGIKEAEYLATPEGQAEQKRKEEERKEEEEAKRRKIEQEKKELEAKINKVALIVVGGVAALIVIGHLLR